QPKLSGDFATLMGWADAVRKLRVRANAETPADARAARSCGAEGIGLSRTEHMFFEADRIGPMREMIMADEEFGRRAALAKLLPMQRADFTEIFRIMHGLPVTIRLLDPPLHEFLPKTDAEFAEMAQLTGKSVAEVRQRTHALYEANPMIELPRAALLAGEIARTAEFFSFGTNDLTQTVYGISRDDAASFIGAYQKLGVFPHDPFVTLDTEGVGEMIRIAAERGRAQRPDIKLGICGEHGGDPASIQFC